MPKLAVYGNLIFFIVAYDLSERWHIHVANNKSERKRSAKIWLDTLEVFERGKLSPKEINTAVDVLKDNKEKILHSLQSFAAGGKPKNVAVMTDMQSFKTVKPVMERVTFRRNGFMAVELEDGRIVQTPLSNFPGIANLTPNQRRQYSIIDDTILMFRDDDEVYHIQDFLGTYETNAYQSPGKQPAPVLVNA